MTRFYANENFPLPTVVELRALGHDVQTAHESGRAGHAIPDEQVPAFAVAQSRAVVTINRRDFIRLHRVTPEHAGLAVCTFDPDFVALARRVDAAARTCPTLAGKLLRVNRPAS